MSVDLQKEAELIEQAKRESSAFTALYEMNLPQIYRYVYYRVGHKQEVEDIVSQTFLQALENLHTFRPRGIPFCHWLYRIANNIIYHHRLRQDKEQNLIHLMPQEEAISPPETSDAIELLSHLSDTHQKVLTLRYVQDLSIKEVAQILGYSQGAIKQICFRALNNIRKRMEEDSDAEGRNRTGNHQASASITGSKTRP